MIAGHPLDQALIDGSESRHHRLIVKRFGQLRWQQGPHIKKKTRLRQLSEHALLRLRPRKRLLLQREITGKMRDNAPVIETVKD